MALSRRVILSLLFNDGVLFRTKKFVADYRYTQAYSWSGDADEITLIDVTRNPSPESRERFYSIVERYCREADIPMSVGGNVRSLDEAIRLLNAGCEKILIGWGGRDLYEPLALRVGCQSVVAGIDFDGAEVIERNGAADCGSEGSLDDDRLSPALGLHGPGRVDIAAAASEAERRGAGELLLTSIARDGSLAGYDLQALRATDSVGVPRIIAGGCGSWRHMVEAFETGAAGAATSNINHIRPSAMRACKQYLAANYSGPIRPAEAA